MNAAASADFAAASDRSSRADVSCAGTTTAARRAASRSATHASRRGSASSHDALVRHASRTRRTRSTSSRAAANAASAASRAAAARRPTVSASSADSPSSFSTELSHSSSPSSGTSSAAASEIRSTSPLVACRCASSSRPAAVRRSRNQFSTSRNRWVPNSFSSSFSRSPVSARRNFANSPCGSSTTWKNCSAVIPSRFSTSCATSSMRVCPSPCHPLTQVSDALACSLVNPSPRFFGRRYSGLRSIRNLLPCTVSSSVTTVRTSGSA